MHDDVLIAASKMGLPPARAAEAMPRRFWHALPDQLVAALTDTRTPAGGKAAVAAYVNHDRWIAECPDCHGAQTTSPADPRFMCALCGNETIGGRWRAVTWPQESAAIDAALYARPAGASNWEPGETVAALQAETAAYLAADTPPAVANPRDGQHASTHEGHIHGWPLRLPTSGDVSCTACGLVVPAAMIRDDRKNGVL